MEKEGLRICMRWHKIQSKLLKFNSRCTRYKMNTFHIFDISYIWQNSKKHMAYFPICYMLQSSVSKFSGLGRMLTGGIQELRGFTLTANYSLKQYSQILMYSQNIDWQPNKANAILSCSTLPSHKKSAVNIKNPYDSSCQRNNPISHHQS